MYSKTVLVVLVGFCSGPFAVGQLPQLNTLGRTQCRFQDHAEAMVEYSTMRISGRKIFGGVLPYGTVWEMGLKQSPSLITDVNLVIGGKELPAGRYSLNAIPNLEKWTLIAKKVANVRGSNRIDEGAAVDLTVRRLRSPVENFTISFDQFQGGCVLNIRWEETEASVLVAQKK